ncbi:hypothetical protein CL614_02880 [archaeon]|nr:hypothetical protein [archaeon]
MIILRSEKLDSVIIVKQEDCHIVSQDALKEYLSAHRSETHYYATNVSKATSEDILFGNEEKSSLVSRKKNIDSDEIYYRTAQNQIIAVEDMEGLTFNSSNDMKSHSGLIIKYKKLSKRFKNMLDLGYLEKMTHEDFIEASNNIAKNKKPDEDIIVRGSVSEYIDDLQDSGAPDDGPARIDL